MDLIGAVSHSQGAGPGQDLGQRCVLANAQTSKCLETEQGTHAGERQEAADSTSPKSAENTYSSHHLALSHLDNLSCGKEGNPSYMTMTLRYGVFHILHFTAFIVPYPTSA